MSVRPHHPPLQALGKSSSDIDLNKEPGFREVEGRDCLYRDPPNNGESNGKENGT